MGSLFAIFHSLFQLSPAQPEKLSRGRGELRARMQLSRRATSNEQLVAPARLPIGTFSPPSDATRTAGSGPALTQVWSL